MWEREPATRPPTVEPPTVAETPAAVAEAARGSARSEEGAATEKVEVHATATGRRASPGSSEASVSGDTPYATPRQTLLREEVARARVFVAVAGVFALLVAVMLPMFGGDRMAKAMLACGLFAVVASSAAFSWALRRDDGYTLARANAFTYVCILAASAGIWFFGVFSTAAAVVPFGVAFFALGENRRSVFVGYVAAATLYALMGGCIALGVLADRGLMRGDALSKPEQFITLALIEGIFLATFLLQRGTREAAISAIKEHDRVVRSLAQRDALLREARLELAHAIQVGGPGRWTGEVVGAFRLGVVLGRGAMGEVYEAVRMNGGGEERAAVKLLHPHVLAQPQFVQRFVREAKIVASLDVANVVRVLDVSPPDAPVPYLAMERLIGRDLADYLREHKRMAIAGVLSMLRQVGAGLDAARAAGVVHRDLKPRNLFFASKDTGPVWKILDFGIARVTGDETLTHNQVVGTPGYMAPEQANGFTVTHRTDLFALGVIAYRSLTGRPAFEGETPAETLYKVVHAMPVRPSAAAPLSPQIDLALAVAMAKDPSDRFASAAEFADALEDAAYERLGASFRARAEKLLGGRPWSETPG